MTLLKLKKCLLFAALWLTCASGVPAQPAASGSVLILYDSTGVNGWIGGLHAKMLANLLGHFDLPCQLAPVENYQAGDLNQAKATFYIGLVFDNPLPAAFTNDVQITTNPVCWFKYNLWQIGDAAFNAKHGFQFFWLDWSGYSNIVYKGESFQKNQFDPELGYVSILDTNLAVTPIMAWKADTNGTAVGIPYATRSSNFWYIADSPFDYISEEDRYVAFADLLHDIVGIDAPVSHRAIIRIEDVSPEIYTPQALQQLTDLLHSNNVPFALALIPVYTDPLGVYNGGVPLTHYLSDTNDASSVAFLDAVRYAVAKGAQIIIHGYTHQYDSVANPYTGTSGDDFEFWRETFNTNDPANPTALELYSPVAEDSAAWAVGRINLAKAELSRAGLGWVAWEPPHYAASATDYQVFATNFPLTMQRVLYFDDAGHVAGQFFPYVISKDVYGQKIMPENLGNFEPVAWLNYPGRSIDDLLRTARKNLVVRDGWANAYFHGFFDVTNLHAIVTGIQALGYTYVPLSASVPPTITVPPQNQAAAIGSTVKFSVAVVGTAPLSYRWKFNGVNVGGANTATLTLANFQPARVGGYSVVITNAFGTVTSTVANLTIGVPPAITTQPQSRTNLTGTTTTFTVAASGSAVLQYQWRFNNLIVNGETNTTLTFTNLSTLNTGNYVVVVTNAFGAVTSTVAALTVVTIPAISAQPQSCTNLQGTTAQFSLTATGTGPLSYRWQFNHTDLAGQTNTTLNLINVQTNAAGDYTVVVTNLYGAVTSVVASLTITAPPTITAQPQSLNAIIGTTATFNVGVTGSTPLRYQWRLNNVAIPGSTNATLTFTNVQTTKAGNYSVVITNTFGAVTSTVAALAVGSAPALLSQPVSRTNLSGTSVVFSTVATGTAPLKYQWQKDGVSLAGATSTSLVLANVQTNNAGNYTAVVSNTFGAVTSAVAALTVNVAAKIITQPLSQAALAGTDVTLNVVAIGTGALSYQWRFNNVNLAGATNSSLLVTNMQAAKAGLYSVVVTNAYGIAYSTYAQLTLGLPVTITTQPVSKTNLSGTSVVFSMVATGTAPLKYQWQKDGVSLAGATSTSLVLANVQTNHAGNYTVVVSNTFGAVTSAVASLTVNVAAKIITQPLSQAALAGTDVTLNVVAIGSGALSYQWRFNNVNLTGATNSSLIVTNMQTTRAGLYSVVVTNAYGIAYSTYAQLTLGLAVTITTQPVSKTNLSGTSVVFSTAATGTAVLGYQWRFNGVNLAGATSTLLVLVNVQTNHAGNYTVVVSNTFGAVTSAVASLTVNVAAKIITQPLSQAALVGTDATFNVAAIGTGTLSYQWRFNNVNLTGATNSSLIVTNMQTTRAGLYSVVVTNTYGIAYSTYAQLTLGLAVTITTQPVSKTNLSGTSVVFSTAAAGTAPLGYQWRFNGANLAGATGSTLVLVNVQTNHAGNYTMVVSNTFGAVTSAVASLTVNVAAKIITQPLGQTVVRGSDVDFTVAATGTGVLSYQWRFNNVNIVGATNVTLTRTNVQLANYGYFSVVVSNPFGTAYSAYALLVVR